MNSVQYLFRPKSVAIVGASEKGGRGWARTIYENLEINGFPVEVFLINPRGGTVWGQTAYPDFASIPEPVDLALTLVPTHAVADVLEDGARNGLKCALIYSAGFGEGNDPEGQARGERIKRLTRDFGLRICGPNCMGALSLSENLLFYPTPRVRNLPAGPTGVIFQSGGTFQYWLGQAATRGLGFSYAVSSGNELDIDIADYTDFFVDDPGTRLIVCLVEGIRRPDAFMRVAERALQAKKPILLVKIGASEKGQAAAMSHTGALAGDDDVFNAVCRKYGIIRCHSLDTLIETSLAFQAGKIPAGGKVAMAGYSGGAKGLFLDYASEAGLELAELSDETRRKLAPNLDPGLEPGNPLDTGARLSNQPGLFSEICQVIAADDGVDMVCMQGQLPISAEEESHPEAFADVAKIGKPVIAYGRMAQNVTDAGRAMQEAAGVPFLQGLPENVRALKALGDYSAALQRGVTPLPAPDSEAGRLGDAALFEMLTEQGIRSPEYAIVQTPDDAAAAAAQIGFPVALKIVSPDALHKTDLGAVVIHLGDETSVQNAAAAMLERLGRLAEPPKISGFMVQEQIQGLEMIAGVHNDPQFGPVVVAGLGGVHVEALQDVAFRLLPVSKYDALDMIGELRSKNLFAKFRGRPARDRDAAAEAICALSDIYLRLRGALYDLEINPLMVLDDGNGIRAVDVRPVWK